MRLRPSGGLRDLPLRPTGHSRRRIEAGGSVTATPGRVLRLMVRRAAPLATIRDGAPAARPSLFQLRQVPGSQSPARRGT